MSACTCPGGGIGPYAPWCPLHGHLGDKADVHLLSECSVGHQSSDTCWCRPVVQYIAQNGSIRWLHQEPR